MFPGKATSVRLDYAATQRPLKSGRPRVVGGCERPRVVRLSSSRPVQRCVPSTNSIVLKAFDETQSRCPALERK
eukprot:7729503-Lingulodinium_polyedra.AAC.1